MSFSLHGLPVPGASEQWIHPQTYAEIHARRRLSLRAVIALLLMLALPTACGTGISLDPTSSESTRGDQLDASDALASDASLEVTDVAFDVATPPFDSADASQRKDGDTSTDADRDISLDPGVTTDSDGMAGGDDTADGKVTADSVDDLLPDGPDAPDEASDAVTGDAFDAGIVDAADGCTVACGWPDADYYVDAQAPTGGDGSKRRPFKTITSAIAAYPGGVSKKAYVAAGTYDETLGEQFPLVLRGLSLLGAGSDQTIIVGSGALDHSAEGGAMHDHYLVTVVAGDRMLATDISGVAVRSISPVPTINYFGVFCDRGSATGEVVVPGGQTRLEKVTVGPGYNASVLATNSTTPTVTGCNLVVHSSLLTGGWAGVMANGCDTSLLSGPVVIEVGGPEPSDGNTISWMQASDDNAAGVRIFGCVRRGVFQNNAFVDSVCGFYVDNRGVAQGDTAQHVFTFKHNSFERLAGGGIVAYGDDVLIDELSDNRFVNITRAVTHDPKTRAIALSTRLLQLGKVRRNQFIGNDFGIFIGVPMASGPASDLGTVDDPGNNVFRCNSSLNGTGADLSVMGDSGDTEANWSGTLHLAGNSWDHAPPSVLPDDPIPNGCDISTIRIPHVTLDLANSSLATPACPADRVPGR